MAKRKITPAFRARLSEKLMDLGNLVVAGLVIGQFISNKEFSPELFFAGILLAVLSYIISYLIDH